MPQRLGHRPVAEHLLAVPLCATEGTPLTDLFKAAAARGEREFYDDVLLVDAAGRYLGMIPMRTVVRLQTEFLLGNIARVEASRREIKEKNRQMEDDLRMAREVQLAMLPPPLTPLSYAGLALRISHRFQPAGGVSGDFFHLLPLGEHSVGILVCDVMGHGVRSALVTAMVRAMVEELRPVAGDPAEFLSHLNRELTRILRQTGSLIFVTAAYAVLDLVRRQLNYAQAGHPTPLRWDGASRQVRAIACGPDQAGPALGLMDDFVFVRCEEPFGPGDRVLIFTDGLVEAADPAGEEFGHHRLANALARLAGQELEVSLESVMTELKAFARTDTFADDVCVVVAELSAPLAPGS